MGLLTMSNHLMVALIAFVMMVDLVNAETRCPARCLCFRSTVRCMFLQLDQVPAVPANTTILDLRFNRIRDIGPNTFRDMKQLNTLLLNNNHINQLQKGVFNGLKELRYLYLYKNRIKDIDKHTFHDLPKLEQLYLHFNQIDHLDPETFSNVPSLERLFLHNNKLQRIPSGAFHNMESLKRLRLDSNALICDCQILWLAKMLNEKQGTTQAAAICQSPDQLNGRSVTSLIEEFNCKKPVLTEEPTDVEITFGGTVYFTCKAEGDPEPDIVWLYNNNEISPDDDPKYQVLQDGTLMIENASDSDMGSYECMAKSPAGEVKSRSVHMKPILANSHSNHNSTKVKPKFVVTPEDVDVQDGSSARLDCEVTGLPKPVITWTFNDGPVDRQRTELLANGGLVIRQVRQRDAGTYRCTAGNSLGKISAPAQLRVLSGPVFSDWPRDQTTFEEATVEMGCSADGYPSPGLVWTKDGAPLMPDARTAIGLVRIRIERVQLSDQGRYRCTVSNQVATLEAEALLTVIPSVRPTTSPPRPAAVVPQSSSSQSTNRRAPFFIRTPESIEVLTGNSAELLCSADGDPAPTIVWRKDGQNMRQSAHVTPMGNGSLVFRQVQLSDEGTYECTALNEMGVVVARARMRVRERRSVSNRLVLSAVEEARRAVDRAVNETIAALFNRDRSSRLTHNELIRLNRFPTATARELARAAEVYERALAVVRRHIESGHQFNVTREFSYEDALSPQQLDLIANASGCLTHRRKPDCNDMCFHSKYRTFDGTCNNFQQPLWGSSLTGFRRLLKPIYENGFNLPVGWSRSTNYKGFTKPSARLISTRVVTTTQTTSDEIYTHMLMQWGQFLDHDLDLAVPGMASESFGEFVDCRTSCDYSAPCFPIEVPPNDPRIRHHRCMEFVRNSAVCGSGATSVLLNTMLPREQINQLTSYIDASQVYGSTDREARELREVHGNNGHLRRGLLTETGGPLLPFATPNTPVDCKRDREESEIGCFLAGDVRANEQTGLLAMHTLWFREHNRVADELRVINPHWDGDMLYHESRKIIGAIMQHITYEHWLPLIIGHEGMISMGHYKEYNPQTDATISNVFATAALRMGHGLIQPVLQRLNASFLPIPQGHLLLQDAFFAPWRLVEQGGVDPILRGLFAGPAKVRLSDQLLNANLTESLFRPAHLISQDLAALNIQRGRDHALPGYNDWRRYCKLPEAETFDDLQSEIHSQALRDKLQQLYGHPSNIDIWVGGMAEDPVQGAKVGPTFRCLLVEQFRRLRDGDRFWYENPGVFKPEQLTQIKQSTLARVICDSSDDILEVTKNVFKMPNLQSPSFVTCNEIPKVDLRFWAECCHECSNAGQFNSITRRTRRSLDHSYPEDKPAYGEASVLSITSSTSDSFYNNSIPGDEEPVSSRKRVDPQVFRQQAQQSEQQDERIEGLEAMMAKMQRTLKKMARKLKYVESICLEKPIKKKHETKHSQTNCLDSDGVSWKNGESWDKDTCTECNCLGGFIRCTTLQCPVCENPRQVEGECCPLCDVE